MADAVRHYMCNNYVQLGAGYPHSDRADATVHRAHQLVKTFAGVVPCSIPGGTGGEVILGEFIFIFVWEIRLTPCVYFYRFVVHAVARDAWARASTCSTPSVMRSWCNARVTRLTSVRGLTLRDGRGLNCRGGTLAPTDQRVNFPSWNKS